MSAREFGLEPIPASVEAINKIAGMFRAVVHGDTATEIDVEFPTVHYAITFLRSNPEGWRCELRDPITLTTVADLDRPVVLIVYKD